MLLLDNRRMYFVEGSKSFIVIPVLEYGIVFAKVKFPELDFFFSMV